MSLWDELAHNLEIAGLDALRIGAARLLARPYAFEHDARLLHEIASGVLVAGGKDMVHASCYELASTRCRLGCEEPE